MLISNYHPNRSSVSNIVVALDLDSQQISVLCHMGDFGCGDGGWTPVMKIDGKKVSYCLSALRSWVLR